MLCVGSSIQVLVAGRVLQGLSAAIVWTVGLALLVDTVGQKEIGKVMGYVSLSMSIAILVAPLLGGVVYERGGYYAVFAMAFALLGLDILLRFVLIEKKVAKKWSNAEDGEGHELGNSPAQHQKTEPISPVNISDAQTPSAEQHPEAKKRTLRRCIHNLPPVVTLLKSRRLLAALWGCAVQAALLTSFDSVLPLFVNRTFGWSSTGAGLIFLALIIPSFSAPLVGWASDKYGPRWLATTGFILAFPFLVLLRLVTHHSLPQIVLLCALLALLGLSLTLVMPPLMAEITYVVEAKEKKNPGLFGKKGAYAQAYGLFNCAFAAGTLIGPIWAGFVEQRAGWGTMAWSLGLLSALSAVPTVVWTGGLLTRRREVVERMRRRRDEESGERG
ncbi:hypothetical protein MMC16_001472 [Acarospora aff. strigata]|nr:hypothetical protein [Acarospora aff. strigata]